MFRMFPLTFYPAPAAVTDAGDADTLLDDTGADLLDDTGAAITT